MSAKQLNPAYDGMTDQQVKRFKYWEFRTMAMCIFGYALFYFVRKNLSIAMPYLNEEMGISKSDLGLFLTLHGLIYGLSKFFNGIWGDRSNARYFLVTGLVFCGICNLLFGFSSSVLALAVGREKGTVTEEYYREVAKGLLELPAVLEDVLGLGDRIADLSKIFTYAHNFIYLGRGYNYPTALEGALKLKEISYIHAEGYPAAEMKHGAIALIDNEMPTVAIATPDNTYEKTASNIEEIRARGGKIIAVIARDDTHVRRSADYTIEVPVVTDCLMPIVVSVPLQLLAYYIAVNKGRNVDQPRNLAKSVTVE